jgi:hypothetical protein
VIKAKNKDYLRDYKSKWKSDYKKTTGGQQADEWLAPEENKEKEFTELQLQCSLCNINVSTYTTVFTDENIKYVRMYVGLVSNRM